jgi:hypothetical protein
MDDGDERVVDKNAGWRKTTFFRRLRLEVSPILKLYKNQILILESQSDGRAWNPLYQSPGSLNGYFNNTYASGMGQNVTRSAKFLKSTLKSLTGGLVSAIARVLGHPMPTEKWKMERRHATRSVQVVKPK